MEHAYAKPSEEILHFFNVDERSGLNDGQVSSARAKYGRNGERSLGSGILGVFTDVIRAIQPSPKSPRHQYGNLS